MSGFTRRPRGLGRQQQHHPQPYSQQYPPPPYGQPGYGQSYPPGFTGGPPPGRDNGGRIMLWLTLVGTVATVVSVLVGLGVGPFDVTGINDKKDDKLSLEGWVTKVNELCAKESTEATTRLQAMDTALAAGDITTYATEINAFSRRLTSVVSQVKGVRLPDDGRALQWRDLYEKRAEHVANAAAKAGEASALTAEGDEFGAEEALNETDAQIQEADRIGEEEETPLSKEIGTSCP